MADTFYVVTDYGVVGDGTTDDTAAFQTALSANANKPLLVPKGLIVSCGQVELPAGITLMIAGEVVARRGKDYSHTGSTYRWIFAENKDDISIIGLGGIVTATYASASPTLTAPFSAIYLYGCNRVRVNDLKVYAYHRGIEISNRPTDCIVESCYVNMLTDAPMSLSAEGIIAEAHQVVISNCTVVLPDLTTIEIPTSNVVGIALAGGTPPTDEPLKSAVVNGNIVVGGYTGITGRNTEDLIVSNNVCRLQIVNAGACQGLYLQRGSRGVRVVGNLVEDCSYDGILVDSCDEASVVGNHVRQTTPLSNPQNNIGISIGNLSGAVVQGNTVSGMRNTHEDPGGAGCCILVNATQSIVQGNFVEPRSEETGVPTRGIIITGTRNVIEENVVSGDNANVIGIRITDPATDNRVGRNTIRLTGSGALAYQASGLTSHGNIFTGDYVYAPTGAVPAPGTVVLAAASPIRFDAGASLTLVDNQCQGAVITNGGAIAAIVLTLPSALPGMRVIIYRIVSFQIQVTPQSLDHIGSGGAGASMTLDTDGTFIELFCSVAGTWTIVRKRGTTTP